MVDAHQVNSLIASVIHDCRKDHPMSSIDPEEAKTIAKCIIQQLSDAGLEIMLRKGIESTKNAAAVTNERAAGFSRGSVHRGNNK